MKTLHLTAWSVFIASILAGCSLVGHSAVDIAPYTVLHKDNTLELRHYPKMVLVSASMTDINGASSPFRKLFGYISGDNNKQQQIAMTAPVFMEQVNQTSQSMAFVMPADMDLASTPLPDNPSLAVEEVRDYTVATITFSGLLSQSNIQEHQLLLEDWIEQQGYRKLGSVKAAGYNPPLTIPALRRNEVLIQVAVP